MLKKLTLLALAGFILPVNADAGAPESTVLFYSKPAKRWDAEALPVGNGRLGAMVFGGVENERIQFNEDSLWTGDENMNGSKNRWGDYNTMGAFQNFGDLFIRTGNGNDDPEFSTPTKSKIVSSTEGIDASTDGNPNTKWCLVPESFPVIWQQKLAKPAVLQNYVFTSANDVPARDPRVWRLEGSNNGKDWTTLDKQTLEANFADRQTDYVFKTKNTAAYSFYRFVFESNFGVEHFQLAEVELLPPGRETATPAGTKKNAAGTGAVPENYRRELNLETGVAATTYKRNGVTFMQEVFASHPDNIIIIRRTADKPGSLSGEIELKGAHNEKTEAEAARLSFAGELPNNLKYRAVLHAFPTGGTVTSEGGILKFSDCDSLMLILDARTDYAMNRKAKWRSGTPWLRIAEDLAGIDGKTFDELKARAIADNASLFNRAALDIGTTGKAAAALPTDERLRAYRAGGNDPDLEEMLFNLGRYLLIASSRRPGLAANLQGLWNDSNNPPWSSDYHTNINVQMNYWPAETANLSECHLPFLDIAEAMAEPSREASHAAFGEGKRGWTMRTSHNIFGGNGWDWNIPASAWYALHFAEHYRFTEDKEFLENRGYPFLKEICEFWVDHLKLLPDGRYVAPDGWSPEHGPREDGVAHDQQIIWQLFNDYVELADILGIDKTFRDQIAGMRDKLVGPKIGRWGQLMEWMTERPDLEKSNHRHTSHLFAVYPGNQISVTQTPEWAKAAAVSLEKRGTSGDSRREWAWAWRCNLWARLQNAERAYAMVRGLIGTGAPPYSTLDNLFGSHPPMQMDGNWGISAGMIEMVLQSHAGEIHLLPALPKEWPNGSFKGLRARGNFTVDADWNDGKIISYKITSPVPKSVKVRIGDKVEVVTSQVAK